MVKTSPSFGVTGFQAYQAVFDTRSKLDLSLDYRDPLAYTSGLCVDPGWTLELLLRGVCGRMRCARLPEDSITDLNSF